MISALFNWPGYEFAISHAHDIVHGEILGNLSKNFTFLMRLLDDPAKLFLRAELKRTVIVNKLDSIRLSNERKFAYTHFYITAFMFSQNFELEAETGHHAGGIKGSKGPLRGTGTCQWGRIAFGFGFFREELGSCISYVGAASIWSDG